MWFPSERKTRRGTVFSPFWPSSATALCSATFDVAPLLRASVDLESKYPDEVPDSPSDDEPPGEEELNNIDEESPHPAPRSPSPAPKRVRLEEVPRRQNHRHKKRRDARHKASATDGQTPRAATLREQVALREHVSVSSVPIPSKLDATDLPAAHGAYEARPEDKKEKRGGRKRRTLTELLAVGFRLIKWNGIDSRPIIDAKGRIIAVLAGRPNDPTYIVSADAAYEALKKEAAEASFPRSLSNHRRGSTFPAFNTGTFYGKGTRTPILLDNGIYNGMLARLISNAHINRMAVYASSAFALWAPRVYNHYHERDAKLRPHFPHLPRLFPKSVFSCAAFNFGPNVWTVRHRDGQNAPFGWCAVAALGPFDHTKGGHLVLWDLKLVVEFPSGSTILLPSATIAHSNIPVDFNNGDERASFTQYTAGGLLRFIDNQFRTEKQFEEEDPEGYAKMCEGKAARWEMGLGLMSTLDELFEPA